MMKKHELKISKTARYFQLGEKSDKTKEIWFVLHGYGQLASSFLKRFTSLNDREILVVAPEGLHRFYWEGFSGKVVASWMTKEERQSDISDYIGYLDAVYTQVVPSTDARIRLLGFSQGTATACRWALLGQAKFDDLILWSGAFPDDVDYINNTALFNSLNIKLLVGDKDQFFSMQQVEEHKEAIVSQGVEVELITFDGEHEIYDEPLMSII
jgi:predicted esterase